MDWAEETVQKLRELWNTGLSTAQIGLRLGVSKNAVVGKAHRLDLPARQSPIIRDGQQREKPTRVPRAKPYTLPLLSCLNGSTPAPEPRNPYVPRIRHPEAPMARPTPAHSVRVGPVCECRWPIGDPKDRQNFRFCDAPSEPGKSYCETHRRIAYVVIRDRREDQAA